MPISDFALDKFVEPHFSKFRSASIPVSADESTRWLQAFVLNCMFRGNFVNPTRQFVFNYLRRVEAAQLTYRLARTETLIGEPICLVLHERALSLGIVLIAMWYCR